MDVYKTDLLRHYRSLVIYLNELSLSDQTSHVSVDHRWTPIDCMSFLSSQFAKMFHVGQWLRDLNLTIECLTQTITRRMKPNQAELVDEYDVDESMNHNNNTNSEPSLSIDDGIEIKKAEKLSMLEMLALPEPARKQ